VLFVTSSLRLSFFFVISSFRLFPDHVNALFPFCLL
jgi:hypothetical protein